jgi:hypothetical protein
MAGRNARAKFERYLVQRSGGMATRVSLNGSQTMWEIMPGGPLALLRSGELDRERRISTKLRPVDLATLLARPDSVVVFLCSRLRPPIVVPAYMIAAALAPHLDPNGAPIAAHVFIQPPDFRLVQVALDLAPFVGHRHIDRLLPRVAPRRIPPGTHAGWQAKVASIGQLLGMNVHVPVNDRLAVHAAAGGTLGPCNHLPPSAMAVRKLGMCDIALSSSGAEYPAVLLEVEHGSDVTSALDRFAHVLVDLTARGAPIPRMVVVAEARRRNEMQRKLLPLPLYQRIGLAARAEFWSYEDVAATLTGLRLGVHIGQLPLQIP